MERGAPYLSTVFRFCDFACALTGCRLLFSFLFLCSSCIIIIISLRNLVSTVSLHGMYKPSFSLASMKYSPVLHGIVFQEPNPTGSRPSQLIQLFKITKKMQPRTHKREHV